MESGQVVRAARGGEVRPACARGPAAVQRCLPRQTLQAAHRRVSRAARGAPLGGILQARVAAWRVLVALQRAGRARAGGRRGKGGRVSVWVAEWLGADKLRGKRTACRSPWPVPAVAAGCEGTHRLGGGIESEAGHAGGAAWARTEGSMPSAERQRGPPSGGETSGRELPGGRAGGRAGRSIRSSTSSRSASPAACPHQVAGLVASQGAAQLATLTRHCVFSTHCGCCTRVRVRGRGGAARRGEGGGRRTDGAQGMVARR